MSLRTKWIRFRHRAENAAKDLLDRLRGRCCRAPLYMVEGGYHFWRCGLRRGHAGPCRFVNYLWGPGGSVYSPVEKAPPRCDRKPCETRRQRRFRLRWQELSDAKRRAADAENRAVVEASEAITADEPRP